MDQPNLFEQFPHPLLIVDQTLLRLLKGNNEFFDHYKYSPQDIAKGKLTLKDMTVASEQNMLENSAANAGIQQVLEAQIWAHESQNGDTFSVKMASQQISFEGADAILLSIMKINDRIKRQEELRRNAMLFEYLFADAPQAITLVNGQSHVERINRSFEHLFGFSEEELTGKNIDDFIIPDKERPDAVGLLVKEGKKSVKYSRQKRRTKEGKILDVLVGVIPIILDGKLIAGFGIYNDITDQKETQRKLQQSLDEKRVLIEEVHHRVKNNLAVISGLLQMQILHVDDARLTRYIRNSQLRIRSMSIVHEMLYKSETLSLIEMDNYVQKLAAVISDTLSPVDKIIKTTVNSDNIVLNVNQAIPAALIISELITNAYEFAFDGQEQGTVTVNLGKNDKEVSVSVSDNGIGLPLNFEEMREKSLGITLVENLCMQLETEIEIESGKWGTRFGFTFQKNDTAGSSSSNRV